MNNRGEMKKIFQIEVKEVLQDTFEIVAENSKEAEYLAEKGFYDGKYVLDSVDAENRNVSFIDKNSSYYMSDERKKEIFRNLINYVYEHSINEKDYYRALTNIIGLSNEEINNLEIDIEDDILQDEVAGEINI